MIAKMILCSFCFFAAFFLLIQAIVCKLTAISLVLSLLFGIAYLIGALISLYQIVFQEKNEELDKLTIKLE